jgi:hypothetical protein
LSTLQPTPQNKENPTDPKQDTDTGKLTLCFPWDVLRSHAKPTRSLSLFLSLSLSRTHDKTTSRPVLQIVRGTTQRPNAKRQTPDGGCTGDPNAKTQPDGSCLADPSNPKGREKSHSTLPNLVRPRFRYGVSGPKPKTKTETEVQSPENVPNLAFSSMSGGVNCRDGCVEVYFGRPS